MRLKLHLHMGIVLVLLLVSFYATCILAPVVIPRIVDFASRVCFSPENLPSLSNIGLFLDIIGVLILWKFPISSDFHIGIEDDGTQKFIDDKIEEQRRSSKKYRRYKRFSGLGIIIIIIGFALQILDSIIVLNL